LIGVGYILGLIVRRGWKTKVAAVVLVFLITLMADTVGVLGFLMHGFGFLPWINYFILGSLMHELYRNKVFQNTYALLIVPLALVAASSALFVYSGIAFSIDTRNEVSMVLLLASLGLLMLSFLIYVSDRRGLFNTILSPFERVGKIAFSVYYLHFGFIFAIEVMIGYYTLPSITFVVFLLFTIMIFALLERAWQRREYRFGLEWLLRKSAATMQSLWPSRG
jgi:peptidoglycan/LPS O-acetylase OafA/YrhL